MSLIPEDADLARLFYLALQVIEDRTGIAPRGSVTTISWIFDGVNRESGHKLALIVDAFNGYEVKVKVAYTTSFVRLTNCDDWETNRRMLGYFLDGIRDVISLRYEPSEPR